MFQSLFSSNLLYDLILISYTFYKRLITIVKKKKEKPVNKRGRKERKRIREREALMLRSLFKTTNFLL
jgi:hypothetical protein